MFPVHKYISEIYHIITKNTLKIGKQNYTFYFIFDLKPLKYPL